MRKRIIDRETADVIPPDGPWIDVERLARVELTSEDDAHPVESALAATAHGGWRASGPGEQILRLQFDEPLNLRRIQLRFRETDRERTQEFVVKWSPDGGRIWAEVVRQQFHFSPPTTESEEEDYRVELDRVSALEIRIVPDISGGAAHASLERLRLA